MENQNPEEKEEHKPINVENVVEKPDTQIPEDASKKEIPPPNPEKPPEAHTQIQDSSMERKQSIPISAPPVNLSEKRNFWNVGKTKKILAGAGLKEPLNQSSENNLENTGSILLKCNFPYLIFSQEISLREEQDELENPDPNYTGSTNRSFFQKMFGKMEKGFSIFGSFSYIFSKGPKEPILSCSFAQQSVQEYLHFPSLLTTLE